MIAEVFNKFLYGRKSVAGNFLLASLVLFPAIFVPPAYAAITPAGEIIRSSSSAGYRLNGNDMIAQSNEAVTGILPVYGPLLLPDGTALAPAAEASAFSLETVYFQFTLANNGNADDSFVFQINNVNPSGFIPLDPRIYLDVDSDGQVDPGEDVITGAGPLASGEVVSLILSADLPSGVTGGETAHLDLVARSASDTSRADAGNVVRITARDEARISLEVESDRSQLLPGETLGYTIRFSNSGERDATDVVITDYIDYGGMSEGTEFVGGSLSATLPGRLEYFDIDALEWLEIAPPLERVKGVRLHLDALAPASSGEISFSVRVDDDHRRGDIYNSAAAEYTGGDGQLYGLDSNEISVFVLPLSRVAIGPVGDPEAPAGSLADRVVISLSGSDTTCTFWHEILSSGNFNDTVKVSLSDSTVIPADWDVEFVDGSGLALEHPSRFTASVGVLAPGETRVVGLRLGATPERFREFPGRELAFTVEAASLSDTLSRDEVEDILVKSDLPLLSVDQSIREPNAMVGDILSYIVTIENRTEETTVDSIQLVESISPGLGYAGGTGSPSIEGNILRWDVGTLGPGEKKKIVFRARVKAGQEHGELVSMAWAFGVSALGERTSDGPAIASIRILEGVFSRKGLVFGSVFIDSDGDGIRQAGEPGAGGVSVFLENGTYAVTDSAGMYSLPRTVEGTHVVRVDPKTLPDSLSCADAGHFGLGVAGEYLIDLAPSGNRRVDFPLRPIAGNKSGNASAAIGSDDPAIDLKADENEDGISSISGAEKVAEQDQGQAADRGSGTGSAESKPAGKEGYEAITIPSSYFEPGSAIMEEIPIREVAALGLWMMENPGWKIMIAGHTDNVPISTADYPSNFELSLARARTLFQVLRMNGIPEEKMDYTGFGSRRPLASNDSEEGRALNRRVEIKVIPPVDYSGADPGLPAILAMPDTTVKSFSLADDAGVCSEIVKPDEGHIFTMRDKIDIETLSPLASIVELYVNNIPVGREKIGQKQIDVGNGTIGFIFYDVKIREGRNDILVVCRSRGERNVCVRHVYLAGRPAAMVPERERISVPADGKSSPEIVFLVNDSNGLPVRDGIFVTVTGPEDLLAGTDVNPHQSGIQAATAGGRVVLKAAPSLDTRHEKIHLFLDDLTAGCRVDYDSPMRDWFLFGYGETDIGYSSLTGSGSTHRSGEKHQDGLFAEGKFSMFGQGEIGEGHLVTFAVDSRPLREERLLGRIEPEKQYPVYGDAAELRFNTASRSGTYLKVDHRRYSAMFGDFQSDLGRMEFTKYNRTFNGISGEARLGKGSVKSFITRTDQVTWQEEIAADGTSGFYFLEHFPLIENSEKIRIEVRDRYRPEKIIRVDYKQVFRDYDINYMDGSILFKEPLASVDENLNPVVIVVSYECRNEGEINFIYGIRPSYEVADSLVAGATVIVEEEGAENSSILGLDLSGKLIGGLSVESEFAHSDKFLLGSGNAFRFKLSGRHGGNVAWSAYFRDIDRNFFNPSFTGGKTELGSRKTGADLDWRINNRYSIASKAFRHDFSELDEKKDYIDVAGLYRSGALTGKAGLAAASHSDSRDGSHSSILVLGAVGFEKGRTKGELQIDKGIAGEEVEEYPNRIQARLLHKLTKKMSATLKHEYRTGRRSGTRHLTQLGLETQVNDDLNVYSRYRMEGAVSGERGQAIVGLKNRFKLSEELTSTFTAEKLSSVSGSGRDDFTAFASGWVFTPKEKRYQLKGDYEIRLEPDRNKHLLTLAGLRRVGTRWSGMAKGDLWYSNEKIEKDRVKANSTVGIAFRPAEAGPLTLLSLVKTNYEKNSPAHPEAVDKDLLVMTEASYILGLSWEIEGKVAGRWVRNSFEEYTATSSSFLYQTQVIRKFAGRWDVTFATRLVHQRETGTLRFGGGLELGRVFAENLWVGAGYDFGGHRDADSPINEFSRSGFHFGMKMKFNEKILEYFHSGGD